MGVLCRCPPPGQKGQKKEWSPSPVQEHQRGDSSHRELFMLPGLMRTSLVTPGSSRSCAGERGTRGSCTAVGTLCCSAHQGSSSEGADGAAVPVCLTCTLSHSCSGKKLVNKQGIVWCHGCPDLPKGGSQGSQTEVHGLCSACSA